MPATHLIRVDLPAPLSPTSAITSPSRTSKSTSVSACTERKCLDIPLTASVGVTTEVSSAVSAAAVVIASRGWGRVRAPTRRSFLFAVLRVCADAHLALLEESVLEEHGVVRLRDRHGLDED